MKRNKKGFTLAELLIVVAIIAVLTAVAIPVFTASTTKAKAATEKANARSTYAEATSAFLLEDPLPTTYEKSATYDKITYTAKTTNSGETWVVTLSGSGIVTSGASFTFPE